MRASLSALLISRLVAADTLPTTKHNTIEAVIYYLIRYSFHGLTLVAYAP